jgi:hypothetical protein
VEVVESFYSVAFSAISMVWESAADLYVSKGQKDLYPRRCGDSKLYFVWCTLGPELYFTTKPRPFP